jgi:transcriptional regulator with XRE-family HTH domain
LESLGARIKRLRKEQGLSQIELGARVGMKQASISQWEDDQIEDPPLSSLRGFSKAFGISIGEFLGPEAPKAKPAEVKSDELLFREALKLLAEASPTQLQAVINVLRVKIGPAAGKRGKAGAGNLG